MIQKMDSDGDGRISQDEWLRPPQAFKRIDRDKDSFVTVEELREFTKKRFSGQKNSRMNSGESVGANPELNSDVDATASPGYDGSVYEIIDTHVHLGGGPKQRNFAAGASEALSKMPERHVAIAIVLPTPQVVLPTAQKRNSQKRYDYSELRRVNHSDRIRIGGGAGILGKMLHGSETVSLEQRDSFRDLTQSLAEEGIVAFGEIGLYHFALPQIGNKFGSVPLNHPLLDVLGDVAAKAGIPIDVHFDVVPRNSSLPKQLAGVGNPGYLKANLAQFEQFLSRNRKTKIVWAHAGLEVTSFRTARLCADLLQRHNNLYMSIRLTRGAPKPSAAMDTSGQLKNEWKQLFTRFPDRFVLGSESMYGSSMSSLFDHQFVLYQKLLAQLPPAVARKIASENALAIYPLGGSQ
ncbi:MAG: amidohydrolase family protein [Gammaproteobacteria bacterium]|nr:MAG: amidohydrolase family protein [Gammaproteobacteria bacterium]